MLHPVFLIDQFSSRFSFGICLAKPRPYFFHAIGVPFPFIYVQQMKGFRDRVQVSLEIQSNLNKLILFYFPRKHQEISENFRNPWVSWCFLRGRLKRNYLLSFVWILVNIQIRPLRGQNKQFKGPLNRVDLSISMKKTDKDPRYNSDHVQ